MHNAMLPPITLSPSVEAILVGITDMDLASIKKGWSVLRHLIWSSQEFLPSSEEVELFNLHGLCYRLGKSSLYVYSHYYVD
ncbi:hypothetical protein PAXRUDRAFT_161941 [Paxillus rubicundulus Ve08.2h10]|uniref:Uncharacterized protein n=1 Tax=Paxillus rubicundulus Ve08.2h10 TaxID=930991 RepID=A0A0D0DEB5_9AGAM|nr:hypothetical protein PAXRUDRAFT_161941 [Paxillus rubicundulus Ve08.2h10]